MFSPLLARGSLGERLLLTHAVYFPDPRGGARAPTFVRAEKETHSNDGQTSPSLGRLEGKLLLLAAGW